MSKSLAASQKVMQSYLSELLTDEVEPIEHKEPENQQLEKLLENVQPTTTLPIEEKVTTTKAKAKALVDDKLDKQLQEQVKVEVKQPAPVVETVEDVKPISTKKSEDAFAVETQKNYREGSFQAMFFDVAGLTIAVPLIELGGIHNVENINSLMGKPDWF